MEKYECIKDLQGGEWYLHDIYTVEEWKELAIIWADIDGLEGIEKALNKLSKDEIMDFIADIWQLEFRQTFDYQLKDIDEKNQAILINVDGFNIWIDYWLSDEGFYEWDFNQYIYHEWIEKDVKTRELQKKIYDDIENFDYFMDDIFSNWGDAMEAIKLTKKGVE